MNPLQDQTTRNWIPLPIAAESTSHDAPPRVWRSLEEFAASPEFEATVRREFPQGVGELRDPVERRAFLKWSAASLGLAGLSLGGCLRQPEEKIVPYVRQPEDFVPGKPQRFATAVTLGGYALGVLVESHLGRPTKIEGNPEHPASLGATDVFAQASILSLYDPDRSQTVRKGDAIATWGAFLSALSAQMTDLREQQGRGLAILSETVTSPTLREQLDDLRRELPLSKWYRYEPAGRDVARAAAQAAFGEQVETVFRFERAEVVLTLDADFFAIPGGVRYARDFISRRKLTGGGPREEAVMSRLYAIESVPSLIGAVADHRLSLAASGIETAARQLASALQVADAGPSSAANSPIPERWLTAIVADLSAHRGASIVVAGDGQPAAVHVLAHAINRALGNVGTTVEYLAPIDGGPQAASLHELADDMRRGDVAALVVLGGNPVYTAPGELRFDELYGRVPWRVHLSEYFDETSYASHWHIPQAHYLETWSDARAFDGTTTIQQPLIAPLYGGKSPHELLAAAAGHPEQSTYAIVRETWRRRLGDEDFETRWRKIVHDGVASDSRSPTRAVAWKHTPNTPPTASASAGFELILTPDPTVWDGRFANNGWLQELPKPLTKLTWENAALVAPATAAKLQLSAGDVVELSVGDRRLSAPVWLVPGMPADVFSLSFGYGRTRAGRIGNGAGVNAFSLQPADGRRIITGLQVRKTGAKSSLAVTQTHYSMEGRDLIRVRTLDEYRGREEMIDAQNRHADALPTLYPKPEESADAWGMVIDQTACVGCNACITACQAENNIPIVGKEQVNIGRVMHWLRVDRYYRGDVDAPETFFQPVPCMHCENAPCELVCPVGATVHSHEGLNQMVYNRCVGTRYCSNNCPYKVRRFNFLDFRATFGYEGKQATVLELLANPDVTVRSRGVMEKCTYCVQRINEAKIEAQKQNRTVRDGEIVTACQQACPTQAITFGNLRDAKSKVAALKQSPLNYSLLAELNTAPRTTYLEVMKNPNPDLGPLAAADTPAGDPTSVDFDPRSSGHE